MKRVTAIVLALLMVLGLFSGCADDSSSEAESVPEASKVESAAEESKQAEESTPSAEGTAEDNGVTFNLEGLKILEDSSAMDLSCMLYIRDTDAITLDGLWWIDHLEEVTGVHVNYEQVNQSDWSTQLNLTFASDTYPDVLVCPAKVDTEMYGVDQGILREVDDLLQYMPNYDERIKGDPIQASPLISSDGKMYTIGSVKDAGVKINSAPWFINRKWLDALDLELPETTEDLYNVLKAFVTQDPDGDGDPTNEVGYEGSFDELTTAFFCCWGIPEVAQHIMLTDDGEIKFCPFMDGYRECVEYITRLYQDGLIDQNVITQDNNAKIAAYNTNKIGLNNMSRKLSMGWDALIEDMEFFLPPHAEGYDYVNGAYVAGATGKAYITVTNEYPVITARWIDAQMDVHMIWEGMYGPEGTIWSYNDEGQCVIGPEGDQGSMEYALNVNAIYYLPGYMYNSVFEQPDYRLERNEYSDFFEEKGLISKYPIAYATTFAKYSVDETNERTEIFANIEAIYDQCVADMIMHGVDDDKWNSMVDQLNGAGVDRYVEIYQKGTTDYLKTIGE